MSVWIAKWSNAYMRLWNLTSSVQHYSDVIMGTIASQITSLTVVYLTVYSDADQRKHQSSASLAFVLGIHRDRWIPRTKGQWRGKCFHLMTSSWDNGLSPVWRQTILWTNAALLSFCPFVKKKAVEYESKYKYIQSVSTYFRKFRLIIGDHFISASC